jgi:hypothetical protein
MDAAERHPSLALEQRLARYFFERLVAAVRAVFAREPVFAAPFLAPFFAPFLLDFVALLPALLAALFVAPFLAPIFLAAVFFEAVFFAPFLAPLAPPFFAAVLRALLPPDFDEERVLLLACAGVEVLESPMALPAASFIRVMAD